MYKKGIQRDNNVVKASDYLIKSKIQGGNNMFKKLLMLMLMLVLSVALVACGGDTDEPEAPADTPAETPEETPGDDDATADVPEKPEKLTMWVNDEESQIDAYEQITAKYTAETGIDVELIPLSMLDQLEALSLDGPAGRGADLFFHPHDRMGAIHAQGLAAELEVTREELIAMGYTEGSIDALSFEGDIYGVPAVVETYALFYNKNILEEAPATMEELVEFSKEFTDQGADKYGFLMEATNFYFTYPFLAGPGGYVFGTDANGLNADDIGLANDGAVTGAEFIQSWFTDGIFPDGVNGDIMNSLFRQGNVGAVVTGPWAIPDYVADLGEALAVVPLPTIGGNNLNSFSGNKGWFVNSYSENIYWATNLALFITNQENSLTYYEVAGELPARTDVTIDDALMNGILAQAEFAHPMPNIPEMSEVWEPAGDALTFISQGDDPREVLEEAVEDIKARIALTRD